MSNTNGVAYRDKSMNGVITLSDGGGTTISNGVISTNTLKINELTTNTIKSTTPSSTVNAYIANTGNINIGGASSTLKLSNTIESFSTVAPVSLFNTTTADVEIGTTIDPANSITIGNQTCDVKMGGFTFNDFNLEYFDPAQYVVFFDFSDEVYFGDYTTYLAMGSNSNLVDIGSNQFGGEQVRIGNATNTNTIGNFNLLGDDITTNAVDSTITMFNNVTTGSLAIATGGSSITVGNFNLIGDAITSSAISSATTLFNNITTGSLEVATGGSSITLGNATNSNKVGNFNLIGNNITSSSATTDVSLMSNLTTGALNIGTSQTVLGTTTIGNSVNSNRISNFIFKANFMTAVFAGGIYEFMSNTTSGSIRFGGGITSGSMTFGTSMTATGFIQFGSILGQIRIFRPFFLIYTTLATPVSNQVGYTFPSTSNTTTLPSSTITTVNTLTTIPIGIWLISANITFPIIAGAGEINMTISQTAGLDIACGSSGTYSSTITKTLNVSRIIVNTAVQTYLLNATQYSAVSQTIVGVVFTATRIS